MGGPAKVVTNFVEDTSKTLTKITQPIEKAVTAGVQDTSKNLIPAELQGVLGNFMGGSGGTDILGGISKSFTDVLQPVEKVVNKVVDPVSKAATEFVQDPSKATTNVLQPVEKTINYIGAHPEMQLALAMAVAVPVVGEYIGAELMAAGAITSAEAASAAAIAAGATAAEAAAAGAAATATATVIGTAIASTSAQVAKGVPLEQAIQNTAADVAVSKLSPIAAKQLDGFINSSAVKNAITSTVTSGAATAARGGSQADIEKAMTAGLAGSAASSAYQSVAKSAPDIYSKTIGGATAGAVKGGTEGAVIGGLQSAAGALGSQVAKKPSTTPPTAGMDGGGGDSELPPGQADSSGGAAPTPPIDATINIPPSTVAGLDITQDQSQAETERLARLNQPATTPPVVEPTQGAYLPASTIDQQILDLINPPAVEPTPTPTPAPVLEPIQPAPVAELYSGSMPDESAAETERLARLNQQTSTPTPDIAPGVSPELIPAPVAELYDSTMPDQSQAETNRLARKEQEILDLITPTPVATEPKQGAYLPDTVPTETTTIEPAPVAEGYSTSMPDQSPAETARLARQEAKAAETADVPAVEVAPSTGTGLIDTPPVSDTDKQILDLISEEPTEDQSDAETERLARKEAELAGAEKGAYLPDSGTDTKTTTYKPDLFTTTYLSPKTRTAAAPTSALGSALGTTGLTSYRGAGEIEGTSTGGKRKKVWNEESLKLKDALGV